MYLAFNFLNNLVFTYKAQGTRTVLGQPPLMTRAEGLEAVGVHLERVIGGRQRGEAGGRGLEAGQTDRQRVEQSLLLLTEAEH